MVMFQRCQLYNILAIIASHCSMCDSNMFDARAVTVICHIELIDMSQSRAEFVKFQPLELNEFRSEQRNVNKLNITFQDIYIYICVCSLFLYVAY